MKRIRFSFEDLEVWQKAVDFADKIISIADEMNTGRKHFRLIEWSPEQKLKTVLTSGNHFITM